MQYNILTMRQPKYINIVDLIWLAGWLEGEGCFYLHKHKNCVAPAISGSSSDRDIARRSANILGISVFTYGGREGCKDIHSFKVTGVEAVAWLEILYPLMGKRRRAKIAECLKQYYTTRKKQSKFKVKIDSKFIREIYS